MVSTIYQVSGVNALSKNLDWDHLCLQGYGPCFSALSIEVVKSSGRTDSRVKAQIDRMISQLAGGI
jgi:hypothetical protein